MGVRPKAEGEGKKLRQGRRRLCGLGRAPLDAVAQHCNTGGHDRTSRLDKSYRPAALMEALRRWHTSAVS